MLPNRRRAALWLKKHLRAIDDANHVILRVEQLEERENPAPIATVTGLTNITPFLGDTATFSFVFTNTDRPMSGSRRSST